MATKNHGYIRPDFIKPELSTKLYKTTYNYLSRFYSAKIFEDACSELKMPISYLLDTDNWVSIKFGAQFCEIIRLKTGDEFIYQKIGRFYLSPENISTIEFSLIKSFTPNLLVKSNQQIYRKSNAVCKFDVKKTGLGKIGVEISSDQPMYRDMAYNTLGILESLKDIYALEGFSAVLSTPDDRDLHSFSIKIEYSAIAFYVKRLFKFTIFFALALCLGWFVTHAEEHFGLVTTPILTALLSVAAYSAVQLRNQLQMQKRSNSEYVNQAQKKNLDLYDKSELLERRYKEASLLKSLSTELVGCKDPQAVIATCMRSISTDFGYKKAAVFLISEERKKLFLAHSIGFEAMTTLGKTTNIEFAYPNPDKKEGFIATAIELGRTSLILDVETYKSILKPENKRLLEVLNTGSLIIAPIQSGEIKFGAFLLMREAGEPALENQDKFLVENIASQLSLYFESASNFSNEVKLRSIFQKYVPSTVLEQISSDLHTASGALSPQKKQITSIFMDLRGFTQACDGVSPERAFLLINTFADFITQILATNGAIIDNIIGDEIVAFFVKAETNPDEYARRAIAAANEIRSKFHLLQSTLKSYGFPELRLGIGIHCGEATIGSVGSDAKMNFTALGSTVNIASRLQSLSKKYANSSDVVILASEDFYKELGISEVTFDAEVLRGTNVATRFALLPDDTNVEPPKRQVA